jgi:pSer/pThr/pTyr-binding forkhead associated (FHA) protein
VTVGRTQTNDICLPDERNSKLHAYFDLSSKDRVALVDAGSRNRTRVNDDELPAKQEVVVRSGDRIAFAHYNMTFLSAQDFQRYVSRLVESATQPGTVGVKS